MLTWKPEPPVATVLVVDDIQGNRAILCRRLARIGYNCVEASSGEAALDHLATSLPDIILLDYMMPEMSGIDLLRVLKSDERTATIPVIMVTARAEGQATAEALAAGADDYVTKPIDFTNLEARIRNVLKRAQQSTEFRKINQTLDNRIVMRVLQLAEMQEELQSERSRCSRLEEEITANCKGQTLCDGVCRDTTLRLLGRIDQLVGEMDAQSGISPAMHSTLLAEARGNIASIRSNLLSLRGG